MSDPTDAEGDISRMETDYLASICKKSAFAPDVCFACRYGGDALCDAPHASKLPQVDARQ
jgi:hypothetical protein